MSTLRFDVYPPPWGHRIVPSRAASPTAHRTQGLIRRAVPTWPCQPNSGNASRRVSTRFGTCRLYRREQNIVTPRERVSSYRSGTYLGSHRSVNPGDTRSPTCARTAASPPSQPRSDRPGDHRSHLFVWLLASRLDLFDKRLRGLRRRAIQPVHCPHPRDLPICARSHATSDYEMSLDRLNSIMKTNGFDQLRVIRSAHSRSGVIPDGVGIVGQPR